MGNLNWDRCKVIGPTENSRGYGDYVPGIAGKRKRRAYPKHHRTVLDCGCEVEGRLTYEELLAAQSSHVCDTVV